MKARIFKNRKAISPVIATVILVSVTIVVAVAVAYWMSGIAGIYTRFEKIEIMSVSAIKGSDGNFTITMQLRNTGSADATIHSVMVNGKPLTEYTPAITTNPVLGTTGLTIVAGGDDQLQVLIDGDVFMSGTTIEVKIHTAAGMDYPRLITLP